MARSGDLIVPRLNGEPFLDKPPLLYWTMALGIRVLGENEWAVRVPNALAFAVSALLAGLLATRLWGEREGRFAIWVYATSLGPFLAANVVTPDTLLGACVVAAFYAYWRQFACGASPGRWLWAALTGVALGLGGLAKGPAVLIFSTPIAALSLIDRLRGSRRLGPSWLALALFVALAGSWYAAVARRLPGAAEYLLEGQVKGRMFSAEMGRNAGALGGLKIYLPTLALAGLPWALVWLERVPASLRRLRGWRAGTVRRLLRAGAPSLLMGLWIALPLASLLLARSRLPLYVLPLMAPLALLTARRLAERVPSTPRAQRRAALALGTCVLLLLSGKAALARHAEARDSRRVAAVLREAGVDPTRPLVTVDIKKNGLALYGWRVIVPATFDTTPYPFFRPPKPIAEVVDANRDTRPVFLASRTTKHRLQGQLRRAGLRFSEVEIPLPYEVYVVEGRDEGAD